MVKMKSKDRPNFFPCPNCGALFTTLALEIHKTGCVVANNLNTRSRTNRSTWRCHLCRRQFSGLRAFDRHLCKGADNEFFPIKKRNRKKTKMRKEKILKPSLQQNIPMSSEETGPPKSEEGSVEHLSVIRFAPKSGSEHYESSAEHGDEESDTELKSSGHPKFGADAEMFFCMNCRFTFLNEEAFKEHQCSDQTSACVVCGVQVSQEVYGDHVIGHVSETIDPQGGGGTGSMKCAYCQKVFPSKTVLLVHYRTHIAQFLCVDCKQHFLQVIDLKHHVLTAHGRLEQHPYHCYICMRRFTHQEAIVNHMRLHTGETPFKCKECGRSFTQVGNLQRHVNTHRNERPHKCGECGCRFSDPATLRNHVRTHTGEMPYVCEVCDRSFSQVGNLKRHMAKHLDNSQQSRPYRCNVCGQGFAHESTRRNHARTHTGEQPYKCTLCPRAFSQIGNLKRHMAKHAAQQDFQCSDCHQNFPSSQLLVQHTPSCSRLAIPASTEESPTSPQAAIKVNVKIPTEREPLLPISEPKRTEQTKDQRGQVVNRKWRIFSCPVCAKVYTWQHDLKIHYRIHSGEKPYECTFCGKRFAQSGAIRTHKRRHHPETVGQGSKPLQVVAN